MWIAFGQGAKMRWIPVQEVVSAIGLEKAFMRSLDVTSCLPSVGKEEICIADLERI